MSPPVVGRVCYRQEVYGQCGLGDDRQSDKRKLTIPVTNGRSARTPKYRYRTRGLTKKRVVGGSRLERDVGVPVRRGQLAPLVHERDLTSILSHYIRNLSHWQSVLAQLLRRVDVKGRIGGLSAGFAEQKRQCSNVGSVEILCRKESNTVKRDCVMKRDWSATDCSDCREQHATNRSCRLRAIPTHSRKPGPVGDPSAASYRSC